MFDNPDWCTCRDEQGKYVWDSKCHHDKIGDYELDSIPVRLSRCDICSALVTGWGSENSHIEWHIRLGDL